MARGNPPEVFWRIAAKRIGCSLEQYAAQRKAGKRWCWSCRRWRDEARFGPDRCRKGAARTRAGGGVDGSCMECRRKLDEERGDRHGLRYTARRQRERELELEQREGVSDGVRT